MMQGFLWLLLQMTSLLAAAALLFLWLGWRWRSQDARRAAALSEARIDAEANSATEACGARDALRAELDQLAVTANRDQAELVEGRERLQSLERQILRLSDELKSARQRAGQAELQQKDAHQQLEAALQESGRLRSDLDRIRSQPLPAAAAATARRPAAASPEDGAQTRARLETAIAEQQARVAALQQEADESQRRTAEGGAALTAAEAAAASKQFRRVQKQLDQARRDLEDRQKQAATLQRTLDEAATLTTVDDLTRIKGIKAGISAKLHAHGLRTFRQIAAWSDEDIALFNNLLGLGHRPERDGWVEQARKLAAEQEETLRR